MTKPWRSVELIATRATVHVALRCTHTLGPSGRPNQKVVASPSRSAGSSILAAVSTIELSTVRNFSARSPEPAVNVVVVAVVRKILQPTPRLSFESRLRTTCVRRTYAHSPREKKHPKPSSQSSLTSYTHVKKPAMAPTCPEWHSGRAEWTVVRPVFCRV